MSKGASRVPLLLAALLIALTGCDEGPNYGGKAYAALRYDVRQYCLADNSDNWYYLQNKWQSQYIHDQRTFELRTGHLAPSLGDMKFYLYC